MLVLVASELADTSSFRSRGWAQRLQLIVIHPAGACAAERKERCYCSCARLCSSATEAREIFAVTGLCARPLSRARSRTAIVVPLCSVAAARGERRPNAAAARIAEFTPTAILKFEWISPMASRAMVEHRGDGIQSVFQQHDVGGGSGNVGGARH